MDRGLASPLSSLPSYPRSIPLLSLQARRLALIAFADLLPPLSLVDLHRIPRPYPTSLRLSPPRSTIRRSVLCAVAGTQGCAGWEGRSEGEGSVEVESGRLVRGLARVTRDSDPMSMLLQLQAKLHCIDALAAQQVHRIVSAMRGGDSRRREEPARQVLSGSALFVLFFEMSCNNNKK